MSGKKVGWDVRPAVAEGRTLLPVRKLVEALGGQVGSDPATGEATLVGGAVRVQLRVGSRIARVNGREVPLAVPKKSALCSSTIFRKRVRSCARKPRDRARLTGNFA